MTIKPYNELIQALEHYDLNGWSRRPGPYVHNESGPMPMGLIHVASASHAVGGAITDSAVQVLWDYETDAGPTKRKIGFCETCCCDQVQVEPSDG